MSAIDVSAQIEIAAEPARVAEVMFNPHRGPEWVQAMTAVDAPGAALEPGARARVTGQLMGRPVEWTSEILAIEPPHRLALKVAGGPFVGTVSYQIDQGESGSCVTIRHQGETTVMAFLPPAMVEGPMRAMMNGDLARLKDLIERT